MRSWIGLSLALAVGSGAAVPLAGTAAEPIEMVRSGGFEDGDTAGIGRGWASESYGSATVQFALHTDKAQFGKSCQYVRVTEFKKGGTQIRQLGMKLAKGQSYSITLWMRGSLSVPVTVGFRKHQAPYTYYMKQDVRVTPAWQRFTINGIASEEDANAGLYILFAGEGDLWVDSISAKPGAAETKTAAKE
jgi:hypothetical protein